MIQNDKVTQALIFVGLAGLMALTRMNHFGSVMSLPDASLAVFFLAGYFLRFDWVFPLLFLEALVIDLLVTSVGGVSSFCITPAYLFLIPTYALMMAAGHFAARLAKQKQMPKLKSLVCLLIATPLAFIISNLGFYLFSGRIEAMSWFEYSNRVAHYFPAYLTSTLLYSVIVLALAALLANGKVKEQTENIIS